MITTADLAVKSLGACRIDSPLKPLIESRHTSEYYVAEDDRVFFHDTARLAIATGCTVEELPGFEPAGPRRSIFFDPAKTRVGIVTCGGLCPGLNDVIRGIVMEMSHHYGVQRIYGFRNGYQGFIPKYGHDVLDLTPAGVSNIDEDGGTILGTSRGSQEPGEIVDCLERMNINALFVIGGDGTIRGAMAIAAAVAERGQKIAVVGIPKTIDNDIPYIDQSFGFQTAFAEATRSIDAAHVEAKAAPNGVGLVKLMGRHLLAVRGDGGAAGVDASGNQKLADIGSYLRQRIADHFAAAGEELNLKYVDPSYMIRSVPANPYDSVYCLRLAQNAVHAAMAGRTEMVIGRWHGRYVHIPMPLAVSRRNQVSPDGDLWLAVLEATGQPHTFG
jgi:6-phosphofructokinase 1